MEEHTIQCPYCFEMVSFLVEFDMEDQWIRDCEVCCQPWLLSMGPERILHVEPAQ